MSNKLIIFAHKKSGAKCYIFAKEIIDGITYITVKYQKTGKVYKYSEERFNAIFEA